MSLQTDLDEDIRLTQVLLDHLHKVSDENYVSTQIALAEQGIENCKIICAKNISDWDNAIIKIKRECNEAPARIIHERKKLESLSGKRTNLPHKAELNKVDKLIEQLSGLSAEDREKIVSTLLENSHAVV